MSDTVTKDNLMFEVYCPHIKRTVKLYKSTWKYKILQDHYEVNDDLLLPIQKILSEGDIPVEKYRKIRDHRKIAIFAKYDDFLPYNKYLKTAFKIIDDTTAVITTVHGVFNLPGSGMEEII